MAPQNLSPYSDQEPEEEVELEVFEVYEAGIDDVRNLKARPHEWQHECTGTTPAPSPVKVEPKLYRDWKPKSPRKTIHDRMSPMKSNFRQNRSEQKHEERLPAQQTPKSPGFDTYNDNFNNNGNMSFLPNQ